MLTSSGIGLSMMSGLNSDFRCRFLELFLNNGHQLKDEGATAWSGPDSAVVDVIHP
jgi:hypothetical protein